MFPKCTALGLNWLFLSRKALNRSVLWRGRRKGVSSVSTSGKCNTYSVNIFSSSCLCGVHLSNQTSAGRGHFYQNLALSLPVWSILYFPTQGRVRWDRTYKCLLAWKIGWMDLPLCTDEGCISAVVISHLPFFFSLRHAAVDALSPAAWKRDHGFALLTRLQWGQCWDGPEMRKDCERLNEMQPKCHKWPRTLALSSTNTVYIM